MLTELGNATYDNRTLPTSLREYWERTPRTADPELAGQPWSIIVDGQALPPEPGEVRRVYSMARVTLHIAPPDSPNAGKRSYKYWLWDGERRQVTPQEVATEFQSRPRWARWLSLSAPGPLQSVGADGKASSQWLTGIWPTEGYFDSLRQWLADSLGPLSSVGVERVFIDDETRSDIWGVTKRDQYQTLRHDPRFPEALELAGITADDFERMAKAENTVAAGLLPSTQRWNKYAHGLLASHLRSVADMIRASLGDQAKIVSSNHHRKAVRFCSVDPAHVYHTSPYGPGSTPDGISCVRQYGLSQDTIYDPATGQNIDAPTTPFARVVRDFRRMWAAVLASDEPIFPLVQWSAGKMQNGINDWNTDPAGLDVLQNAWLLSGGPVIVSQTQTDPGLFPDRCLEVQRLAENEAKYLDSVTGGMGTRPAWNEVPSLYGRSVQARVVLPDGRVVEGVSSINPDWIDPPIVDPCADVRQELADAIAARDAAVSVCAELQRLVTEARDEAARAKSEALDAREALVLANRDYAALLVDRNLQKSEREKAEHEVDNLRPVVDAARTFHRLLHNLEPAVGLNGG